MTIEFGLLLAICFGVFILFFTDLAIERGRDQQGGGTPPVNHLVVLLFRLARLVAALAFAADAALAQFRQAMRQPLPDAQSCATGAPSAVAVQRSSR